MIDEVQCSTDALQLVNDALPIRAGGPWATKLAGLLRVPFRRITSGGEVDANGVAFRVSPADGVDEHGDIPEAPFDPRGEVGNVPSKALRDPRPLENRARAPCPQGDDRSEEDECREGDALSGFHATPPWLGVA